MCEAVRWFSEACELVLALHSSLLVASPVHQRSAQKMGLALALFHGHLIHNFRVLFCKIKEKAIICAGN